MKKFTEIEPQKLHESAFKLIGKDWMLITAGDMKKWNTMTASWGALGELWFKPVAFTFIRPQRYTLEFIENEPFFTLSFFDETHRNALNFCGANSGRDVNKAKKTGLVPFEAAPGAVAFEQARMIMVCRKLYFQDLEPENFLDPDISNCYANKDYHRMFIGEVCKVLAAR
jgi:flavin reductase (DIM6/NTAB) family NADH-FMN oxidoreductase RutF